MTEEPYTLSPEARLSELYDLMDSKHVRHVPVVDEDGSLRGLATHRDLVHSTVGTDNDMTVTMQRELLDNYTVDEIMTREPETINPSDDLRTAASLMLENKFGCLPVVDGEKLVGILTESDFVRLTLESLD